MNNLLYAARPILLDFLSTLTFVALAAITHDLRLSLAVALTLGVSQLAFQRLRGQRIDLMQWASLGLTLVFGGAALLTHDIRFALFKPTLIYVAIGAAMLKPGWMDRYAPRIAHAHLAPGALHRWGRAWAAMMFATAGLNLALALHGELKLWALVMGAAPLAGKLTLFAVQYLSIRGQIRRKLRGPQPEGAVVVA